MKKLYVIYLSEQAQNNIYKSSDYYQNISESLKTRFINVLIECIDLLKENPLHHQIRYRYIRIAFTPTFPMGFILLLKMKIFIFWMFCILHSFLNNLNPYF